MDDCKISHVDSKVNDELIEIIRQEYESIFDDGIGKMTVHRGKVHKYLRMTLDYRKKGVCQVTMFDYIKEKLESFEKMDLKAKRTNNSAAPVNLFTMGEDCKKIDAEKAKKFHSIVAKILFTEKGWTRHGSSYFISHDKSEISRRGRLVQAGALYETYQGNAKTSFENRRKKKQECQSGG